MPPAARVWLQRFLGFTARTHASQKARGSRQSMPHDDGLLHFSNISSFSSFYSPSSSHASPQQLISYVALIFSPYVGFCRSLPWHKIFLHIEFRLYASSFLASFSSFTVFSSAFLTFLIRLISLFFTIDYFWSFFVILISRDRWWYWFAHIFYYAIAVAFISSPQQHKPLPPQLYNYIFILLLLRYFIIDNIKKAKLASLLCAANDDFRWWYCGIIFRFMS